jgi:acid phosphatase family membrane protein YuiD
MEERGLVKLPPRIKPQKNNWTKTFDQIPLFFVNQELSGSIKYYKEPKGCDWQEILKGVICGIIFSAIITALACPGRLRTYKA